MKHIDTEQLKTASFIAGHQEFYEMLTHGKMDPHGRLKWQIDSGTAVAKENAKKFCRRLRSQARQFGLSTTWADQSFNGRRRIQINTPY